MENQTTKDKLIQSAIELFSRKQYSAVSVADICRNANSSNGIFYRYFKNKEEIFKSLVEEFLLLVEKTFDTLTGQTIEERLEQFILAILSLTKRECKKVSIFREGQYRSYEYGRRLQHIYYNKLNQIYERQLTESEYFYILSGLRFLAYRSQFHNILVEPAAIKDIILYGVFPNPVKDYQRIFNREVTPLSVSIEETTKDKLLKSGRTLFGDKDYSHVHIYDITNASELAIGTFYKHFDSKLTFFGEIIDQINSDIRGFISKNIDSSLNRLEQEVQGMYLFCLFLTIDKNCYNIGRESEFVIDEKAKEYYDRFEEGYLKNLQNIKQKDIRTVSNFLIGITYYLGIEMLYNKSIKNVKDFLIELSNYLINGISS